MLGFFFFSSRRRHTRWTGDWSSDVCSSDLVTRPGYVQSDQSLTLEDDPRPRNVIVALNPTGAISGRIFDEYGEPVIGAERSEERRVGKECRSGGATGH